MSRSGEKFGNLIFGALAAVVAVAMLPDLSGTRVLIGLVAVAALAPFLLGPILIYKTHRMATEPDFAPFDPEGPEAPPELRRHFAEFSGELERLGFGREISRRTKQATNNSEGFITLFRNRATSETARIITAVASTEITRNASSFAVLRTEFTDGTEVATSNRASARVYPARKPPYHGQAFPQVHDIGRLLALHRALADQFGAGLIPFDAVGDDPDEFLRQVDFKRPQEHFVACGYNYADEMAGVLRPTWKGAFLMTWKLLPPIKQIRLAWERFRAAGLLARLESGRVLG